LQSFLDYRSGLSGDAGTSFWRAAMYSTEGGGSGKETFAPGRMISGSGRKIGKNNSLMRRAITRAPKGFGADRGETLMTPCNRISRSTLNIFTRYVTCPYLLTIRRESIHTLFLGTLDAITRDFLPFIFRYSASNCARKPCAVRW